MVGEARRGQAKSPSDHEGEEPLPYFKGTLHRAQGPGVPAATPPAPPPGKKPRKKARQVCWLFCAVFLPPVARGRGRRPYPGIAAPFLDAMLVYFGKALS